MSDLVVFLLIVAAVAGVGVALGMILAGRIDRLMASPTAEPPGTPQEEQP
jgi:hypothetical protein